MEKQSEKPRVIDRQVEEYLTAFVAVCIEVPNGMARSEPPPSAAKARATLAIPQATSGTAN